MTDTSTTIALSAFSGLAGAILTQLLTGMFSYLNDKRKQTAELERDFRSKKSEIGENFYYINSELMTLIRKNITYWSNLHNDRSIETLNLMRKEMAKLAAYQERLHNENWKFNLTNVYFDLPFNNRDMEEANQRSNQFYLLINDLSNKIKSCVEADKLESYHQKYAIYIFDLCSHYEDVYSRMAQNNTFIQQQLLNLFDQSKSSSKFNGH